MVCKDKEMNAYEIIKLYETIDSKNHTINNLLSVVERLLKVIEVETNDKNVDKQKIDELLKELGAKQAKIDELMLEYCPEEMTKKQFDDWAKHQKSSNFSVPLGLQFQK